MEGGGRGGEGKGESEGGKDGGERIAVGKQRLRRTCAEKRGGICARGERARPRRRSRHGRGGYAGGKDPTVRVDPRNAKSGARRPRGPR